MTRTAVARMALTAVLACLGTAALAQSASAATTRFRILSGTLSWKMTASSGCHSGERDYTGGISGTVPDDPGNSFTPGPGALGLLSSRSSVTDTSPTRGSFLNDHDENSCAVPPCHYDFGIRDVGFTVAMTLIDIGDPTRITVAGNIGPLSVGAIEGGCGLEIDTSFDFGEPSITVPTAQLFSGDPVTLKVAGSQPFTRDIGGHPIQATVTYSETMRVQALNAENLRIDPTEATGQDQVVPGGAWSPVVPVSWRDKGCTDPPEDTATPRAYIIAGPTRDPLATLLGAKEETLAGAAGFRGRALKLKRGISAVTLATVGANAAQWQRIVDAAHVPAGVRPGRGVFYGGRIACKLRSAPTKFKAAKSPVFTLCRDQSELTGGAWTGMLPEMRAALGRLWKFLEPRHACFALTSGFRDQDQQDAIRKKWHGIADHSEGDKRSAADIASALEDAGFAQDPEGYRDADGHGKRVAKGGPALYSLHSLGVAADVHVEFSDTGAFKQSVTELRAAAAAAGLCGPPAFDPVHVELPFVEGKDHKTGYPTVESVEAKGGKEPKCSAFTDIPPPKPAVKHGPVGPGGVKFKAGAPVGASITGSGSSSAAKAKVKKRARAARKPSVLHLRPVTHRVRAGRRVTFRLTFSRADRRRLRRLLAHHRRVRTRLVVVADYGGVKRTRRISFVTRR